MNPVTETIKRIAPDSQEYALQYADYLVGRTDEPSEFSVYGAEHIRIKINAAVHAMFHPYIWIYVGKWSIRYRPGTREVEFHEVIF